MTRIERLSGREILDSRGKPTVLATCLLEGGIFASASVPSGASTGAAEAFELRDGDPKRYRGMGCKRAAKNLNEALNQALRKRNFTSQAEFDSAMIELDGTQNKGRLGANAILAASVAFARASALQRGVPLYEHFAEMIGATPRSIPRLTINLFSGGKHAGQQVAIQDVLMIPMATSSIDEALVTAADVYQAAAEIMFTNYGMRLLTADEGGLAPPFKSVDEMFTVAMQAIDRAGYTPGQDVALGVDVASTHFYAHEKYVVDGRALSGEEMIGTITGWMNQFPIISVEDGLAEDDWAHWPKLRKAIGSKALTLGDDLLCTNPTRIRKAIDTSACNALLLKVNQIGTLTEAAAAGKQARDAGWAVTLSVRSGETEDNWAADLAVGWAADQFKNGSIRQSERLAKYNRLLEIADETEWQLADWRTPKSS